MNEQKAKTVSLILGSGGARGLTPIGVIRELEERGYRIASIVGCSMGALIGGLHAAGKLADYESWVTKLSEWDVLRFLDISLTSRSGMLKGDLIMDQLRSVVGDGLIEGGSADPVHRGCNGRGQQERDLAESGRPIRRHSRRDPDPRDLHAEGNRRQTLVDGGLLNPFPAAPATDDRTDVTIAVSLAGRDLLQPFGPDAVPESTGGIEAYRSRIESFIGTVQEKLGIERSDDQAKERPIPLTAILMGMFGTMHTAITRHRFASYPPDILIETPGNVCQTHECTKRSSTGGGKVIETLVSSLRTDNSQSAAPAVRGAPADHSLKKRSTRS